MYLNVDEVLRLVNGTDPGIHDGVFQRYASRPEGRRAQNLHRVCMCVNTQCMWREIKTSPGHIVLKIATAT